MAIYSALAVLKGGFFFVFFRNMDARYFLGLHTITFPKMEFFYPHISMSLTLMTVLGTRFESNLIMNMSIDFYFAHLIADINFNSLSLSLIPIMHW